MRDGHSREEVSDEIMDVQPYPLEFPTKAHLFRMHVRKLLGEASAFSRSHSN